MGQGSTSEMRAVRARYQPLLTLLVSMIGGVLIDRYVDVPLAMWFVLSGVSWCGWFGLWVRRYGGTAFLLLSVLSLSGAWHHCRWNLFRQDDVAVCTLPQTGPIGCEGVLLTAPQARGQRTFSALDVVPHVQAFSCRMRITGVRDEGVWRQAEGSCDVWIRGAPPNALPGDRVRIYGQLSAASTPANPGAFDFQEAQRSRRRLRHLHVGDSAALRVIDRPRPSHPRWLIARLRAAGCALLREHIGEARAGLASAILLGERAGIHDRQADSFVLSGTAHLLAISGLHVGILAWGFCLCGRLGVVSRRWTLRLVVLFVIFYAMLTDAQPPVVRAAVLISVLCAARYAGHQPFALNSLAAAAILVLLCNPLCLFSLGTQLSFLAVGVLASAPAVRRLDAAPTDPIDRLIARCRPWPWRLCRSLASAVIQACWTTTCIWFATAPLVLSRFHVLTPVALVVNPLVSLPVAAALFSGFGVLLLGPFLPGVAGLLGLCCDCSLAATEAIVGFFASCPGGHFWSPSPPAWWLVLYYAAVSTWILVPGTRKWIRTFLTVGLAWICLGAGLAGQRLPAPNSNRELICTFISVGHGTSVLLQLPDGQSWLYDAGRLGNSSTGVMRISEVLWHAGIASLDGVIVSHADADHFNALPGLLDRFPIRAAYVSPTMFRQPSAALRELKGAIDHHQLAAREVTHGMRITASAEVSFDILHPPIGGVPGSDNANSVVACVRFAGRSLLLPGDLEAPGSEVVCRGPGLDCDVLMAPHHGSLRSEPDQFLAWCSPEWVIISGGDPSTAAGAKRAYSAGGAKVMHTAEGGAVRVRLSAEKVTVDTWRQSPW